MPVVRIHCHSKAACVQIICIRKAVAYSQDFSTGGGFERESEATEGGGGAGLVVPPPTVGGFLKCRCVKVACFGTLNVIIGLDYVYSGLDKFPTFLFKNYSPINRGPSCPPPPLTTPVTNRIISQHTSVESEEDTRISRNNRTVSR